MWFSFLCLGIVLGVTIRQGAQGLFSAFIMLMLTVCCSAAALGTYEWVAIVGLAPLWKPDYALPISLGVIFGASLLLLRLVFDRLIRRACLLPAWVDRIGGGACGFLTGLIMSGMVALGVQMIPFNNGSVFGYSRVEVLDAARRNDPSVNPADLGAEERELILTPDRFVAGLAILLSDGIFSGATSFYQHHPDLVQEIGWVGAAHAEVSRFAPPGSVSIVRTEPLQFVYRFTPGNERKNRPPVYEAEYPKAGHEFHMVRVRLGNEARDVRKSHVFTLRQFRLVGRTGAEGAYQQFHPVAIQQEDVTELTNRHIRSRKGGNKFWPVIDNLYSPRADHSDQVEIVFELPVGFKPLFLEYKREARVALSFDDKRARADGGAGERGRGRHAKGERDLVKERGSRTESTPKVAAKATSTPPESVPKEGSRRRGRVRTVTTGSTASRFGNELPVTMRSYRRLKNAEISRGELIDGHLVGDVDAQEGGTDRPIERFYVPEGKRLLQLNVERLKSRSALGRALSRAVETIQNYVVMDDRGNQYKVVGKYAIATVRGTKVIEVQYFSSPTGMIGGMGKFTRIDERKLKPGDTFVLLFLVDPGVRIVSFSTGGSASRRDDLTSENLISPP